MRTLAGQVRCLFSNWLNNRGCKQFVSLFVSISLVFCGVNCGYVEAVNANATSTPVAADSTGVPKWVDEVKSEDAKKLLVKLYTHQPKNRGVIAWLDKKRQDAGESFRTQLATASFQKKLKDGLAQLEDGQCPEKIGCIEEPAAGEGGGTAAIEPDQKTEAVPPCTPGVDCNEFPNEPLPRRASAPIVAVNKNLQPASTSWFGNMDWGGALLGGLVGFGLGYGLTKLFSGKSRSHSRGYVRRGGPPAVLPINGAGQGGAPAVVPFLGNGSMLGNGQASLGGWPGGVQLGQMGNGQQAPSVIYTYQPVMYQRDWQEPRYTFTQGPQYNFNLSL